MALSKKSFLNILGISGIAVLFLLIVVLCIVSVALLSGDLFATCVPIPTFNNRNPRATDSFPTERQPNSNWWVNRTSGGDDSVNAFAVGTKLCANHEYVCGLHNYTGDCTDWAGDCFGVVPVCCSVEGY